jgi:hypothetical protein
MDKYQQLSLINKEKQKELDDINIMCKSLNNSEDEIHDKIKIVYNSLDKLNREYNNIIETYSHIIRSSVDK